MRDEKETEVRRRSPVKYASLFLAEISQAKGWRKGLRPLDV
jgi:hypothetical protein